MIPAVNGFLEEDFEVVEQPGLTYKMNMEQKSIRGMTNDYDAVKQALYKILNTERYDYIMYSWNYGIELKELFGKRITYVCPELRRRITEALLWDTRVVSVEDFEFETEQHKVTARFTVSTIYGGIEMEKEVVI